MIANTFEGVVDTGGKGTKISRLEIRRGVRLIPQNIIDKQLIRDIQKTGIEVESLGENGSIFLRLCK